MSGHTLPPARITSSFFVVYDSTIDENWQVALCTFYILGGSTALIYKKVVHLVQQNALRMYFFHKFLSQFLGFNGFFRAFREIFPSKMPHCTCFICPIYKIRIGVWSGIPFGPKVYLKTKKMTNISQAQAGFKATSRRNSLWISRLFHARSSCVCRNRLNFRLFRYTLYIFIMVPSPGAISPSAFRPGGTSAGRWHG